MTYTKSMVFVETTYFTKWVVDYLSEEELREFQQYLMEHPEAGKVIRGSGGIRKIRWSRQGMGKSGGVRIIYYWSKMCDQIYLLTAYSKNERENIDTETLASIAKHLEQIK